jgi:pilus assembly protein FimV
MNARRIILVAGLAMAASMAAQALGIVRSPSNVTLGAPLNFPVDVQLAADESLNNTCVSAEVLQGDQRMAPSTVRTSIEQRIATEETVVRVYSTVTIEEPVVTVTLKLGCAIRLERRFTVFADPPLVTVAAAPEPMEPPRAETPTAPAPPRREAPASAPRDEPVAEAGGGATTTAPPNDKPVARPARPAAATAARAPASGSAPVRRPARVAAPAAPTAAAATTTGRARGAAVPRTAAASGPRLQLDALEPVAHGSTAASAAAAVQEAQLRVAAMAASAAMAEQAASTALANAALAAERMRALEQGLEKLRADAERDREQTAALRLKLAQAENSGKMTPWLGAAMLLLAALALWLWLRGRRLQREQQAAWWAANKGAAAGKAPLNPPTLHPMTLPPQVAPPPLVKPEATVTVNSAVAPPRPAFRDSLFASQQEPRDVSIEELIDLEQQAEFFVVLGQDDAAIDLLMGHIRSSGGTSPLPYLKLLEIYRRQGDRESYERTRERFNHRFNAYAPDWDSDLQHGRSLDEYPGVMQRLVARWREPLDSMAELEALMFRRDGGELFELPAYREVLFLYSMARDLLDHQGGPPTAIDVLLPLGDRSQEFEPTTARPHLFTTPTGLAELSRASDPSIEVLRSSRPASAPSDDPSSVYGTVDVDLTKPLPMDEDTQVFRRDDDTQVFRRDDDQRSDFADLPPPKPKS